MNLIVVKSWEQLTILMLFLAFEDGLSISGARWLSSAISVSRIKYPIKATWRSKGLWLTVSEDTVHCDGLETARDQECTWWQD